VGRIDDAWGDRHLICTAGLTDVELEITVTDRLTGAVRT
jgi:hypothetical protein